VSIVEAAQPLCNRVAVAQVECFREYGRPRITTLARALFETACITSRQT
jgi:hypothetical protein